LRNDILENMYYSRGDYKFSGNVYDNYFFDKGKKSQDKLDGSSFVYWWDCLLVAGFVLL